MFDLYEAIIDGEQDGIYCLSLVTYPATEVNWQCFNADESKKMKYAIQDEEKHIISTVVMTANSPIYRRDGDYEYYIQYSPETIAKMAEKLFKDNCFGNYDIEHNGELLPKGIVTMQELFLVDREKGICPNYVDVPDGSLCCSLHINDEELWQMAKDGTLNGISLAGFFTVKKVENFNKLDKKEKTLMYRIKEMLKQILVAMGTVTTKDGKEIEFDGETLEIGVAVSVEDGEYELEDGKVLVVKDGKVEEIKDKEEEEPKEEPKPEEPKEEEEELEEEEENPEEEEEPTEEPTEEPKDDIETLKAEIEALKEEVNKLKEDVKALINTPVVEPVVEEFKKIENRSLAQLMDERKKNRK